MGEKESVVTIEFEEANSVTLVATTIDFATEEDRDVALSTGMTDGMSAGIRPVDQCRVQSQVHLRCVLKRIEYKGHTANLVGYDC